MGLGDQFKDVKQKYAEANDLLGNIIKGKASKVTYGLKYLQRFPCRGYNPNSIDYIV